MNERTFNLAIATYPYGGNGGVSNEYPGVRNFLISTILKAKNDPRIAQIHTPHKNDFSDTPITMTRNASVLWAREMGADFLLMVDSDMEPDCELGEDRSAKPFFETSLDFLIENYDKGPNVVCAPYCGPPPICNVYVFRWAVDDHENPNADWRIEAFSREEAAKMQGITPVAAQPTGVILFDMRAFELTDPLSHYEELRKTMPGTEARLLTRPWFYYEYEDVYEAKKCSTEDVTATRDISFAGHNALGRDVIYCNWDAWAGHAKPTVVRKPRVITAGDIHAKYQHAVLSKRKAGSRFTYVGNSADAKRSEPNGKADEYGKPLFHVGPRYQREALTKLVEEHAADIGRKVKVAEIGSWVGESAIAMAKGGARVLCIDTWKGSPTDTTKRWAEEADVFEQFKQNVKDYDITWWRTSSLVAATNMNDKFDIIHIDAEHTYEACKQDILVWLPHVEEDGILIGHDYRSANFPGVAKAVHEIFGTDVVFEYAMSEKHSGFWVVRMKDIDRASILKRYAEENGVAKS